MFPGDRETFEARPPRGPKTPEKELAMVNRQLSVPNQNRDALLARKRQLEEQLGISSD